MIRTILTFCFILILALPVVGANTYVSQVGKFYIEYPDSWEQVPYLTIDMYLAKVKAGRHLYDYDAAFAELPADSFNLGSYFIVTVDTVGNLTDKQIDSVVTDVGKTFGAKVKYFPVGDFFTNVKSNEPNFDREKKLVTIVNRLVQSDNSVKQNLIMMKFYEHGIVNFYCFAPDSLFEQNKAVFVDVVNSIGTDDLASHMPKENLKIADIDKATDDKKDKSYGGPFGLPVSVFIVLLIIFIAIRKKKKSISR